jgi:hypothetical protein
MCGKPLAVVVFETPHLVKSFHRPLIVKTISVDREKKISLHLIQSRDVVLVGCCGSNVPRSCGLKFCLFHL